MFTGLVETLGRLVEVRPGSGSSRIAVQASLPGEELKLGESIAVDGVCLTVAEIRADGFVADVVEETCRRTTLGQVQEGQELNLERSLRLADRLGGHLVQGHVDGVTEVEKVRADGDDHRVRFRLPAPLARFVAHKGSIALAGVSLTIADLDAETLEVALVPHTLQHTTLGRLQVGSKVNVEVDLVARYLDRLNGVQTP